MHVGITYVLDIVPTEHMSSFLSFLPICRGTVVLTLAGYRLELPSRRLAFENILVHICFTFCTWLVCHSCCPFDIGTVMLYSFV